MNVYTGIGSRQTPDNMLCLMRQLGYQLACQGWLLRSGGADGADYAFESGVADYLSQSNELSVSRHRIYLPGQRLKTQQRIVYADPYNGYINSQLFPNWERAKKIASNVHPAWHRVEKKPWVVALHARNCYQVLGDTLSFPSQLVVYWAPITPSGDIKGGTRTAVKLADYYQIPTYNLACPKQYERLFTFGV